MSDLRISGNNYQPQYGTGESVPSSPAEKAEDTTLSLIEQMQEAREKAEELRKKFKLPKNSRRYGDAAMAACVKLVRARNVAQVNAAAGYAKRQLYQLKAARRQDPENARQIQGAIDQLQKAVNRAGKKRRDLCREELAEKRQKKLAEEEQIRKARRLREQLRKQRSARVLRESGYIREAEISQRMGAHMDAANAEMREQFQGISDAAQTAAISNYAAQAASLATAPPTPTVTNEA